MNFDYALWWCLCPLWRIKIALPRSCESHLGDLLGVGAFLRPVLFSADLSLLQKLSSLLFPPSRRPLAAEHAWQGGEAPQDWRSAAWKLRPHVIAGNWTWSLVCLHTDTFPEGAPAPAACDRRAAADALQIDPGVHQLSSSSSEPQAWTLCTPAGLSDRAVVNRGGHQLNKRWKAAQMATTLSLHLLY